MSEEKLIKDYMRVKSKNQLTSDLATGKERRETTGVSTPRSTLGSENVEILKPKLAPKWENIDPEEALFHPAHPDPIRRMNMEEFTQHAAEMLRDPRLNKDQKKSIVEEMNRRYAVLQAIKKGVQLYSKYHKDLSDMYQISRRSKKEAPSVFEHKFDKPVSGVETGEQAKQAVLADQMARAKSVADMRDDYNARVAKKQEEARRILAEKAAATGRPIDVSTPLSMQRPVLPPPVPAKIINPPDTSSASPVSTGHMKFTQPSEPLVPSTPPKKIKTEIVHGGHDAKKADEEFKRKLGAKIEEKKDEIDPRWISEAEHSIGDKASARGLIDQLRSHFLVYRRPDNRWRLSPRTEAGHALLRKEAELLKQKHEEANKKK